MLGISVLIADYIDIYIDVVIEDDIDKMLIWIGNENENADISTDRWKLEEPKFVVGMNMDCGDNEIIIKCQQ